MASRNVDGEIIVGINQPESLKVMNEDLKKILSQMNNLEAIISHAKLDKTAAEELLKQIRDLKAEINISNVKINQTQITSDVQQTGQKMGKQMGDNINQGLSKSLRDVKYAIADMLKNFPKLNSFNLSSIFNLNRKDIDSSVTMQVREITKEIETLSTQVLKTNSDSSWEGVIDKIASLRSILNQFGQIRDTSSFKESIDLLDYFNNKKIYVGNKDEVLKNTGRTLKELNNEFMNLVKFTTSAKDSIKLDTIWDELSRISPGLEKFISFGDQIKAIVDQFKIAKEAMYGNSGLQSASETNEVSNVLMKYMDILENAAKKLSVLRGEQTEIEQMIANGSTSAADKVIQNEQKKQEAIRESIKLQSELATFNTKFKETGIATINENGVVDMKKSLEEVRNIYSDFGKVTIKNEMSDLVKGTEQFRVSIESSNGELKRTESFLMKLSENGKSFVFADDMIRSSESTVRHLNEQQEATNKVILEEEKLANAMADVREKAEQTRQAEEKRQQLAQNKAINKALEEEYKERQKNIQAAEKQVELDKKKALAFTESTSKKLSSAISKYSYGDSSDATAMMKQMNRGLSNFGDLSNIQENIKRLSSTVNKIISDLKLSHEQSLQALNDEIKAEQTLQSQKDNFNRKNLNAIDYEIQKREQEAKTFSSMLQVQMQEEQKLADQASKIQYSMDTGEYESKVETLIAKTRRLTDENGNARISTIDLLAALNELTIASTAYASNPTETTQKILIESSEKLVKEYETVANSVRKMNAELTKTTDAAKAADKQSKSLFASLKSGMGFLSYWTSAHYVFMRVVRGIKEVINNVRELESALLNISYTMDVSGKQLRQIGESSLQAAKDLHTSASKVLAAVQTFANSQETAESIIEKSKPTIMMSNVTGMDTSQTVDILQGVMEQFDLAEDQLMHISDVMQTVSMSMPYDFADGVKELSEGIKASGSVAKDAGYDLENYTALLGTLIAKTRQSGGELGRSLRTMFVRTTKASTSALASGEVTEDDLSNAEKALRRVGIEVRSDIDTFKSFDQIMGELYEKVDSLSDVDLSNIAYEVASTRQTNVFKMMIKAYGDYQEMAEKAYNADNVTLENQQKYAESLTGKMGELSATWENISNDTISSNFLKGLADAGIGVSSLIEKIGLLKSVMASVGIAAFVKSFA